MLLRSLSRLTLPLPVVALALALAGCNADGSMGPGEPLGQAEEASVCAAGTTVKGVDVSIYQGTVNWTSVHNSGRDFAIARISDGTYLDTKFAANWSGIKAAGMIRGAYQFFEPGDDPTTQANIVINAVGKLGAGDLPVTADMEVTGGEGAATIVAHLKTWIAAVKAGTGKEPMIYTAEGYWNGSVGSTAFSADPLWAANWGVTCPTLATGWSNWKLWQNADNGSVSGISGNVDTDEFNGDLAALTAFAGASADWGAQYVSQSWPLATTTMKMTVNQVVPASITLKNIGTKAWDSNTKLATTQPRDRTSPFVAADWLAPNRLAHVTGTVAPGANYTFKFNFQAPNTPGAHDEFYGIVQEGVAWFSDSGQAGPPDNDIEAKIQVNAMTEVDGGSGAGGGDSGSGGAGGGSGAGGAGAGGAGAGGANGAGGNTGGGGGDGTLDDGGVGIDPGTTGGCACNVAGESDGDAGSVAAWVAAAGVAMVVARRRRR
jgi:lysozyme